ncbi:MULTISPECIES: nucleotidyltransferase [Streptococcus]|uniref:SMODS domain-containing nucleotidyltransferase n=1 Tax=Streptococcus TaxID=1301 RepID=UPI001107397B|nr:MULTISPECIES: nucleotidyltransferase [Streptococcus]
MSLSNDFKEFCEDELPMTDEEWEKWKNRLKEITKRLNRKYYSLDDLADEEIDNGLIVGSVGRTTAVRNVSDFDYIFSLPSEVYRRFDSYEGNGQSALLQEIKNELLKRYPNTKIKGDGQVVVIDFSDGGKIELVPAFEQSDGNFKYPDSRNGGSWKTTKPKPEIEKCKSLNSNFNNHFSNLTRLIRRWKNHMGFSFKGLLIDALISDFIDDKGISEIYYSDYNILLKDIVEYFSSQDKNREYWYALGSNQKIYNNDGAKFINKAKQALKKIEDASEEKLTEVYRQLFGRKFAQSTSTTNRASNEKFIDELFNIDIRYNIVLECEITQYGFRKALLSDFLKSRFKIKNRKSLDFEIIQSDIPDNLLSDVKYYWKVRNIGAEAIRRNCERGAIFSGKIKHHEDSQFKGDHYVECYAVLDNTVIARDRITVPIDPLRGKDFIE